MCASCARRDVWFGPIVAQANNDKLPHVPTFIDRPPAGGKLDPKKRGSFVLIIIVAQGRTDVTLFIYLYIYIFVVLPAALTLTMHTTDRLSGWGGRPCPSLPFTTLCWHARRLRPSLHRKNESRLLGFPLALIPLASYLEPINTHTQINLQEISTEEPDFCFPKRFSVQSILYLSTEISTCSVVSQPAPKESLYHTVCVSHIVFSSSFSPGR